MRDTSLVTDCLALALRRCHGATKTDHYRRMREWGDGFPSVFANTITGGFCETLCERHFNVQRSGLPGGQTCNTRIDTSSHSVLSPGPGAIEAVLSPIAYNERHLTLLPSFYSSQKP